MLNFLDKLYTSIDDKNAFFKRIMYYSALRFLLRVISNAWVHISYRITFNNTRLKPIIDCKKEERIIVSLTTIPARVRNVWIVIESMMRQSYQPDMIILWLSREQFNSMDILPKRLLRMQEKGLQIKFCNGDLRAHKKYFYSIKEYPNDCIITVDDDILYSHELIMNLHAAHSVFPNVICCNYAGQIPTKSENILPSNDWKEQKGFKEPSFTLFPIGAGGVLYPPKSLHGDLFKDDILKRYCLSSDDIWLNIMARMNRTKVVKTTYYSKYIPIIFLKNKMLFLENVNNRQNDIQIENMRNYYLGKKGIDPYENSYFD
jgi:uncharacterized pyridoxamine 5'-phosphate oxidase family protein